MHQVNKYIQVKIKHDISLMFVSFGTNKHGSSIIGTEEGIAAPAFYYSHHYRIRWLFAHPRGHLENVQRHFWFHNRGDGRRAAGI